MIKLIPEPLTQQNFAPFGQVIEMDMSKSFLINADTTRRYHDMAEIDVSAHGGVPILSIFSAERREFPLTIKMVEKHPLSTQAFLPMQAWPWLVVVASGDTPSVETCRAFLAQGNQGVQYGAGVWHHPLLICAPKQDFWVVDRKGEGDNLVEHCFKDTAIEIVAERLSLTP